MSIDGVAKISLRARIFTHIINFGELDIMNYLLLVASSLCNAMKNVYAKKSNAYINEKHNIYTYNFYMFLIAFLVMLFFGLFSWTGISLQTVIMGTVNGAFLIIAQIILIKATNIGDVSVSSLFYSCGFLVPTFASVFMYDEQISFIQVIGVILIIVSFAVTVEKKEKATAKWFVLAVSLLLCNGVLGLVQKMFRMSEFRHQQSCFQLITFFIGMIFAFCLMPKKNMSLPSKGFLTTVFGSGIALVLLNVINVYVSGVLPAIIVFPCTNGGGIIASAILARILIREKISLRKKAGIAIGVAAICLIAL